MIKGAKDKNMDAADVETKQSGTPILREFSFSGEGIYVPMTIEAADIQEATEIYETKKVKIIS